MHRGNPAPGDQEVSVEKEDRGFALMSPARRREVASKGGKAAHQKGTAHEWTSEEAREAGRKGGMASHRRRKDKMDPQGGEDRRRQEQATDPAEMPESTTEEGEEAQRHARIRAIFADEWERAGRVLAGEPIRDECDE